MQSFFSSTDTTELHEKAENGLYLSLIVNNHMEPVAKIAWTGEIERTIESYSSWGFGHFRRQRKKSTRKELVKVYYEIELDIEFNGSITDIAARYSKLHEEDKSFIAAARNAHIGHQTNFYGHGQFETAWDKRKRIAEEEEAAEKTGKLLNERNPAEQLAENDFTNPGGQNTGLIDFNSEADLATQLESFSKLDTAFAAILTQDPKTKQGLAGALAEAMDEVKNIVVAMRDTDEPGEITSEVEGVQTASFIENYSNKARTYAEELLENGDTMIAEMLEEFYIEQEEYFTVLQRMYDSLASTTKTILGEHLKEIIVEITLGDESEELDTLPEVNQNAQ